MTDREGPGSVGGATPGQRGPELNKKSLFQSLPDFPPCWTINLVKALSPQVVFSHSIYHSLSQNTSFCLNLRIWAGLDGSGRDYSPPRQEDPGSVPQHKLDMVVHTYNPSSQEAEAGRTKS